MSLVLATVLGLGGVGLLSFFIAHNTLEEKSMSKMLFYGIALIQFTIIPVVLFAEASSTSYSSILDVNATSLFMIAFMIAFISIVLFVTSYFGKKEWKGHSKW